MSCYKLQAVNTVVWLQVISLTKLTDNMNNTTTFECNSEPTYITWILRLAYSIIFILGTFGNAVVCIAILKRKGMKNSCNMLTFNLAFHDLILVIVYVPTQMMVLENCYYWPLGGFMCYLVYFILPLSLSVSIGTLLAITADRYRAIVFPVKSKLTRKSVMSIVAVIWVVSALTALPLLLVLKHSSIAPGVWICFEDWPTEKASEIYWLSMFVFQYLLPLSIIAILAGITAYTLKKNSLPVGMETCAQSEVFRKTIRKRVKQTKRITNMLIALVLLYAICMLPQHAVFTFLLRYGDVESRYTETESVLTIIANIFPIANSALNAIAYGTLNKEFKAVFNGLFKCLRFDVTARKKLFESQTVSGAEMSAKKNGRCFPLLQNQDRKERSGEMASTVTRKTYVYESGTRKTCNQGINLPNHDIEECLLVTGGDECNQENNRPDHDIEECLLKNNLRARDIEECMLVTGGNECIRMQEQKDGLQRAISEGDDEFHKKETEV